MNKIRRILRSSICTTAIILAGGSSTRMNGASKQFIELGGIPILARTLLAFERCRNIDGIVVVAKRGEEKDCLELCKEYSIKKLIRVVTGGASRQESAFKGLSAVPEHMKYVAFHDGARPFITPDEITAVLNAAHEHKCAIAATKVTDTIKVAKEKSTLIDHTPDRELLYAAQTPQVFYKTLYEALALSAARDGFEATDDASLAEHYGHKAKIVLCSRENIKITTPFDLSLGEVILKKEVSHFENRTRL